MAGRRLGDRVPGVIRNHYGGWGLGCFLILLLACILLLWGGGTFTDWTKTAFSAGGVATSTPRPIPTAAPTQAPGSSASAEPTKAPVSGTGFQFVERPAPLVTPNVTGKIDWNEQLVIADWRQLPGLYPGVQLYYNQSAVGKVQSATNLEVKEGAELLFGAVSVDITVKDAKSGASSHLTRSGGVYGAIPAGQIVTMTINDGFMAMGAREDAQKEYCARVAQAVAEKWALSTTFPDPAWKTPVCEGTYSVPVDSDRLRGGSIPSK